MNVKKNFMKNLSNSFTVIFGILIYRQIFHCAHSVTEQTCLISMSNRTNIFSILFSVFIPCCKIVFCMIFKQRQRTNYKTLSRVAHSQRGKGILFVKMFGLYWSIILSDKAHMEWSELRSDILWGVNDSEVDWAKSLSDYVKILYRTCSTGLQFEVKVASAQLEDLLEHFS